MLIVEYVEFCMVTVVDVLVKTVCLELSPDVKEISLSLLGGSKEASEASVESYLLMAADYRWDGPRDPFMRLRALKEILALSYRELIFAVSDWRLKRQLLTDDECTVDIERRVTPLAQAV